MRAKIDVTSSKIEWRLLLSLALPISALSLLATALSLSARGQDILEHHVHEQMISVARQLGRTTRWESESEFKAAVSAWPWLEIWLEDAQGAHIWHQTRPPMNAHWPHPQRQRLPLTPDTTLVIKPLALPAAETAAFARLSFVAVLSAALGAALLVWLLYQWTVQRWSALLRWNQSLDTGELNQPAPHTAGLSGQIASIQAVMAQRLRYARDTLSELTRNPHDATDDRLTLLSDELEATREQLTKSREHIARRAEFLSAMSHELRTPLTAIAGFAELLEQGELASESRNYVQTIRKSAASMVALVNDFLDMERADSGQLDIHHVGLDLADIVEDTVSLMAPMAYEKNLELVSIVDHDIPARLIGDPGRVQQILTNLVSNAVKFTDRGEVIVRASRLPDTDGALRICMQVQDSGPGLSPSQQAQLFTPYQRFEQDGQHVVMGSGLGLNIVRKLTDLLGGEVQVESQPGAGATFTVTLPLQPHPQKTLRTTWEGLRGTRLWVAERHAPSWRALQHQLQFWGLNSRHFESPGALQRALENDTPDIILISLQYDEVHQDLLCELIQSSPCPVGIMVNSVDARVHHRLEHSGAAQVLAKSATRTTLYRALNDLKHLRDGEDRSALQGLPVLIAENNPASQYFLKVLLENLGAVVTLADNGQDALARWREQHQRYVFLDLNMPQLDGRQTTVAMREDDPGADTIIIGMSAYMTPKQEREWLDAGLNDLLSKPFDQEQLLRCLHPWLHHEKPATPARQSGVKLVEDPELAAMMREELPKQLDELDSAFIDSDLVAARAAAHQLHGTAAFFHLEPLKSHVFLLEKRLNDIDTLTEATTLREDMAAVNSAVHSVIDNLPTTP